MIEITAIITLSILVLGQLIERHIYSKDMNKRLSEAMKAVMSRNINEFLAATTTPKGDFTRSESDEVDLGDASLEEFDKHIKEINK